jgi:tetratricopeptide (TPR) repeat protein
MAMSEKAKWRLSLGYKYLSEEPRNILASVREFRRVTELAPDWSQGYALLSSALEEAEQIDQAISVSRAGLRVAPEDAQHLISLGRMYLHKREYSKDIKALGKAILLKPHEAESNAQRLLDEALLATRKASK